jgi:hypothetical protein
MGPTSGFEFVQDGSHVSATASDGLLVTWDVASGKEARKRKLERVPANGSLVSRHGNILAISAGVGKVAFRTAPDGKELCKTSIHDIYAVSSDGKRLVFGNPDEPTTITTVDVAAAKVLSSCRLPDREHGYEHLALFPDGGIGATTFDEENQKKGLTCLLFSLADGCEIRTVSFKHGRLGTLVFSPDGRVLAGGGFDTHDIFLWDVATGRLRATLKGHTGDILHLSFSRDSTTLASSSTDTTTLVWDLTRYGREGVAPPAKLTEAEAQALWKDLASDNSTAAYRGMWGLAAAPKGALPLLRARLRPMPVVDAKQVKKWLADLSHDEFPTRENATKELAKLDEAVEAELKQLVNSPPSPEARRRAEELLDRLKSERFAPSAARRQQLRAVEALEHMNTPAARELLAELAKGQPGAWLTRDAKTALDRLDSLRPQPSKP